MKGIILAAGKGSRLYPMTRPVCKPLLPVYDKPMIYYPLSVLMQAGIREIMVIVPAGEEPTFARLLGNGSQWGVHISYRVQFMPRGIADAFLIAEDFIGDDSVALVLGDNIFYGDTFESMLIRACRSQEELGGATVFGHYVHDPRAFGVVEFDEEGNVLSIEEKPRQPRSNYIIPGLYLYDNDVVEIAQDLKPSARGELEITDVNLEYLRRNQLRVKKFGMNYVWMDAGTADSLLAASQKIKQIQDETGRYVGCVEEIALNRGFIDVQHVAKLGDMLTGTLYGEYLRCL
ncbi:MAG: glucose-1-phosphate thymidylyltransferase RfbA [Butyricicoccus sp.]|nr:glucose-1-phosphate thymidylyltransferase RfbA [Butyricicoccus sp.]